MPQNFLYPFTSLNWYRVTSFRQIRNLNQKLQVCQQKIAEDWQGVIQPIFHGDYRYWACLGMSGQKLKENNTKLSCLREHEKIWKMLFKFLKKLKPIRRYCTLKTLKPEEIMTSFVVRKKVLTYNICNIFSICPLYSFHFWWNSSY